MIVGPNTGRGNMSDHVSKEGEIVAGLLLSVMRQLFAIDDAAAELPLAQMRVCAVLYQGAKSMSVITRELGVSHSAVTQITDRLERSGLVARVAEGNDRRVRCLRLTDRGEEIMQLRETARIERISAVLEHLPSQAKQDLRNALQTLLKACADTWKSTAGSEETMQKLAYGGQSPPRGKR